MLGSEGLKLLHEAKRTTPEHLPVYNESQVRVVVREIRALWEEIEAIITRLPEAGATPAAAAASSSAFSQDSSTNPARTPPTQSSLVTTATNVIGHSMSFLYNNSDPGGRLTSQGSVMTHATTAAAETASLNAELLLYQLAIHHNKRILMAYHHQRLKYLMPLVWAFRGSSSLVPQQIKDKMSSAERSFLSTYAKNLQSYQSELEHDYCDYDIDLDLTTSIEHPPRDLFIEVRVVKDCGEVQTEFGMVNLEQGSQHYLRRSDVEHLIAQGYLQHIN
ncbi:DNA replication protein psf1 [Spiromyces aspiralis]|uniref:DNA replication protein psf1 n=1 Tax=Spiromyces aspiralis TaxID=68401 RepID=A0ACC1HV66_9FUNG|nr:DNA replication protein psf1 [Spiromyces aspiralis]